MTEKQSSAQIPPVRTAKTYNISLSNNDKIALVSNMYTMLSSGIPILETVDSLLEDSKGNQRKLLQTLRADLGQGQHVYFTFAKFPHIFDKVTVNIIKASEEAGTLDVTLRDLKENIRKDIEFNDKIKSALIYPSFIIGVFFLVMLVILVVVVPKISTVFSRLNMELPMPTQIMIALSNVLLNYTIPVVLGAVLLIAALVYLYKRSKRAFIRVLIALPVVSKLAQLVDLTRFTRSMHLLLTAGIPITSALELTSDIVINANIQRAIKHGKNTVFAGKKLSQGLKDYKKDMPTIMIKIVEAGEKSGSLDRAMLDISEYLDYEVSNQLKTVTALIEPLLLVVVGVLIGGMMMAIIAPIYGLIGQVGGPR